MSSLSGNDLQTQGDPGYISYNEPHSRSDVMEGLEDHPDKPDSVAEVPTKTPRSARSNASSSEVLKHRLKRPLTSRSITPAKPFISRNSPSSNIPVPTKGAAVLPAKVPSLIKTTKSASRSSSIAIGRPSAVNKHTLEIQYLNRNKRFLQMKRELLEKQKPVLDLYQSLIQIKKKLEEYGKTVPLEELKFMPFDEVNKIKSDGGGENVSVEIVAGMRNSIEEIPKTLMDICKNLLGRRALIVELLESVTKSEIDAGEVLDKIDSLKNEGIQLQQSLDVVIAEHETKINELVKNWQALLSNKTSIGCSNEKVEELEEKLKAQEKLVQESNQVVHELHRRLDDKRTSHDKSMSELNGVINTLREQIKKLEHDLENERRLSVESKSRNSTNAQTLKTLKAKIAELDAEKKNNDAGSAELQRKCRILQEQLKTKEQQWNKDREELNKSLKHQENLLQKLKTDNSQFETRLDEVQGDKMTTEETLQNTIEMLNQELGETKKTLEITVKERDEAQEKCHQFEEYLSRMKNDCEEDMSKVTSSLRWGKVTASGTPEADSYLQGMAKDHRIRELEDTVRIMKKERDVYIKRIQDQQERPTSVAPAGMDSEPTDIEIELYRQKEYISKYQMLLEESEHKLKEKSLEVSSLRSEIRQLRVRQEALEEQNYNCPTEELQGMVEEGRQKLSELMKKSLESEQKIEHYVRVIEKQSKQMNEMENLLRYRENMAGVLKASRDELVLEKESLTRYSQEMRTVLAEVTKEGKMKDRLIKELQEKINIREKQITKLEKDVRELEANLMLTNEKRFKLQETVGTMEKELQSTKAHVNQLADINTRYERALPATISKSKYSTYSLNEMYMKQCQFDNFGDRDGAGGVKNHQLEIKTSHHVPSEHGHCYHDANSRTLISMSMQKIDVLKNRLHCLMAMDVIPESDPGRNNNILVNHPLVTCSTQTLNKQRETVKIRSSLDKIVEITAKRYKYLQNQANESYDDLVNMVKLAMLQNKDTENEHI